MLCAVSALGMVFHVRSNPALSPNSKKWFTAVYLCTVVGAMAEFYASYMDTHPVSNTLHLAVKVLEFSVTPFLPVLMSFACGMEKDGRLTSTPVGIMMIVHACIELVLAPFGRIIQIDTDGVYHRGDWYGIYITFYVISFGFLLATFVQVSRRFRNRDLMTILTSLACVLCGVIPSVIHSSTRTSFLGITMTSIILYIYYEGLTEQEMMETLSKNNKRIRAMQEKTIFGIADLIESRDTNTGIHIKNTSNYVAMLACAAQQEGIYADVITDEYIKMLAMAAPLHDVGKITIPDAILQKPARLTAEEFEIMKRHAPEGGRIVREILDGIADVEYIQVAFDVANFHHEKWDGTGYPTGLAGEEIPVSARIMAIADVYDALTMERVYKEAFSVEKALSIIEQDCGKHFDPQLGALFVKMMRSKKK